MGFTRAVQAKKHRNTQSRSCLFSFLPSEKPNNHAMEPALHRGWKREEIGNGGQGGGIGKEMEEGEERRALVTDQSMSRGWGAPAVLIIKFGGKENMVMRSISFCALIEEDSGNTDITS